MFEYECKHLSVRVEMGWSGHIPENQYPTMLHYDWFAQQKRLEQTNDSKKARANKRKSQDFIVSS